jgi:hypothetical protein
MAIAAEHWSTPTIFGALERKSQIRLAVSIAPLYAVADNYAPVSAAGGFGDGQDVKD